MKEPLWDRWSDKSHTECHWFMLICRRMHTHTRTHTKTPHHKRRSGATAFPGFQRSSRESKDRLDHPKRRSANISPLPGAARSLKIVRVNIVFWHVCLIINNICSVLFGSEDCNRKKGDVYCPQQVLKTQKTRQARCGPSCITYGHLRVGCTNKE